LQGIEPFAVLTKEEDKVLMGKQPPGEDHYIELQALKGSVL
jgi:hypothetical protein